MTTVARMQGPSATDSSLIQSSSVTDVKKSDNKVVMSPQSKTGSLPELKSSVSAIDKSKPLPTSLQSDFLPDELLLALTQSPVVRDKLRQPPGTKSLSTSTIHGRPAPDNLWNYKRKEKFKHLTENTPCICGAGRDISFLYDVPQPSGGTEKPEKFDKSVIRRDAELKTKMPLQLPDTLLPEEYHIVKNRGVMGIEYHEDKYSTLPEDHEKHLVLFPSMKPGSRYEAVQLKTSLDEMLDKMGINDLEVENKGPTQMHNLLELIKKEQNIYNVVFHELIRQVSVECVERGELLSILRQKYSDLLNRIPRQIKSLQDEVMAQRALDRRLTEELMRFKNTISLLTNELSEVKEHDKQVTQEAHEAQTNLKNALKDAQKNTSLLAEYHDLYELQRRRLEKQVLMLADEKELWSTAAYSLALKVTEECKLTTAKRLFLCEKSWSKLASHFTVLLSDKDTELLTAVQLLINHWREALEEFSEAVGRREEETHARLRAMRADIDRCIKQFQNNYYNQNGVMIKTPDTDSMRRILSDVISWEEMLVKESEVFGGDVVLSNQEQLLRIRRAMEASTDKALRVFGRHRGADSRVHPEQTNMLQINEEIEALLQQFHNRVTGENGLVTSLIYLGNATEFWHVKISTCVNGVTPLTESDWDSFYAVLDDWTNTLDSAGQYVGSTQKLDDRKEDKPHTRIDIADTIRKTQMWATRANNSIDSEDAKLIEQISTLHSEMVNWIVQMLLHLAPNKEGNSAESGELALMGTSPISSLIEMAKSLFGRLETFSNYVTLCCNGIVVENTRRRQTNMEDNADHELKDLKRLRTECSDWINTAQILTSQLTGEPVDLLFPLPTSSSENIRTSDADTSQTMSSREMTTSDEPRSLTMSSREVTTTEEALDSGRGSPKQQQRSPSEQKQEETAAARADVDQTPPTESESSKPREPPKTPEPVETEEAAPGESSEKEESAEKEEEEEEKADTVQDVGETVELLGRDDNTHQADLLVEQFSDSDLKAISLTELANDATPDTQRAFQAIAAVQSLQKQLIATEERAQRAEEQATHLDLELTQALESVRTLEQEAARLRELAESPSQPSSGSQLLSMVKQETSREDRRAAKQKSPKGKKK